MDHRPELIDYLSVVFRWWRFLVFGTVAITAVAVLATFFMTPYYTTEATVLVTKSKVAEEGKEPVRTYTEIESHISLIDNHSLFLEALGRYQLREPPYELNLRKFRKLLEVRFLPKTDLLSVSFSFPDPELSQQIATFLLEEAVRRNRELSRAEALESRNFLARELEEARTRRERIHRGLLEYRKESDAAVMKALMEGAARNIERLEDHQRRVRAEVAEGEAALAEAETRLAALPETDRLRVGPSAGTSRAEGGVAPGSGALGRLLDAPLEVQYESWSRQLAVLETGEIAVTLAGNRAEMAALDTSLAELRRQVEEWSAEYAAREQTIQDLEDRYRVATEIYELLATRYNEATVLVGSRSQELRIVDAPYRPEHCSWPRRGLTAVITAQLSLLLLLALAFLLDYISRRSGRL